MKRAPSPSSQSRQPTPHASGAQPPPIPAELVPRHVAIVMDGNGRWAKERGLPRTAGHEMGEASLFDCVEGALELGIGWISAYAFSTENWKRSPDEVRFLMDFNRDVIRRRRDEMNELGVRVRWAGRRPRLWRSVIKELEEAEQLTAKNTRLTLTMCVNYGGRAEIADAVAAIARDAKDGKIDPGKIDERTISRYLDEPDTHARSTHRGIAATAEPSRIRPRTSRDEPIDEDATKIPSRATRVPCDRGSRACGAPAATGGAF